ncbi:MAG: mechanosensitive ion channel [Cyanothece sp. SIO2G6]|nr:mechanosensitive ion channel [Cyanothece sp. SIO2G6]
MVEQIFQRSLFELGGQPISLWWIIKLLLAWVAVGIITRLIKHFLKYQLLSRLRIGGGNREAIATLISIACGAFGYLIVLQATGIDLSSLAVIIGGLGVGIGFGLQDVTKNLLSGLTVLIEQKLRVGDFIEFDEVEGFIEEISIRSTVIRTLEGGELIIPNSQLAEERVTNWNYRDRHGRIEIEVGVAYGTDPVLVTETLLEAAYSLPEVLMEPTPKVIFVGFGDSSLNFKLWTWIDCIDRRALIQSNLTFTVEYYLRQRHITIPFPQLDLWMRSPHSSTDAIANSAQSHSSRPAMASPATNKQQSQLAHQDTLRHWLSQVSYFQNFNELQLRSLIEMGFRKHLVTSEILFRQGEKAQEFCIVLSGAIAAVLEGEYQEKQIFAFTSGQYFGELPLMLGVPYPTTMKAIANTVLFVINQKGFEKLLHDYPVLAEDISQELAQRREALAGYQAELQAIGMNTVTDGNLAAWFQQRLKQLFTGSPH